METKSIYCLLDCIMGWSNVFVTDVYVGKGETSDKDLILQLTVDDDYFPPTEVRITLTAEEVEKFEQEIRKWKATNQ